MSRTLANVRQNVRYHIDEPTANYWSDAELNALIGRSQLGLWRRIYQLKKDLFLNEFDFTTVSGQYRYSPTLGGGVPTDFGRVTSVRTTTSGQQQITWLPRDADSAEFQWGLQTDTVIATPSQFLYAARSNQELWVSPIPQQTLVAKVGYIATPVEVSADTDTFGLLDPYVDFIEYDASKNALQKGPVGNPDHWGQQAEAVWQNILLDLDTPRSSQSPPDVVEGMFEGYSG